MEAPCHTVPDFSLVFPVYNAGSQVSDIVHQVRDFLRSQWDNSEVIFVCDGCTDGTEQSLRRFAESNSQRIRVIAYSPNRGKGYAVRTGLLHGCGRWRLFTDIDLAYSWSDIINVGHLLKEGHQVVVASRLNEDSRVTMPPALQGYFWRRALQGRVFVALAQALLPFRQRDPQAGLKGMSAAVADQILPLLRCDGFAFDCEFLTACHQLQVPVTEIPVRVSYRDCDTTTSLKASLGMIRELCAIRRDWKAVTSRNGGEGYVYGRSKLPLPVAASRPIHTAGLVGGSAHLLHSHGH